MVETISDQGLRATQVISAYNSSLTPEERHNRAVAAGVASGAARRKKRAMKDVLADLLTVELPPDLADVRCQLESMGLSTDLNTAMCYSALVRAIHGDIEACRWVRDSSGNKLSENLVVSRGEDTDFRKLDLSTVSTEELMRMLNDVQQDERLIGESANNIRKNED